jgi:hypothetical protein
MARKEAEDFIISILDQITPELKGNSDNYRRYFASLSDKEFESFIQRLESGEEFICVQLPNFIKHGCTTENNIRIAKEEFDFSFFQRLIIGEKDDIPEHMTNTEAMVIDIPWRRASQTVTKKISVPDDNKKIDALSGQVTGESKAARISYPELQVLTSMGLEKSALELDKYRGGDKKGGIAFNGMLSRYGSVSLDALKPYASGVESTKTLKTYLTGMHLSSTLPDK